MMRIKIVFLLVLSTFLSQIQAQDVLTYTRPSQLAKVFQRIGTTDIEIIYHAPLVNGRKIFGELVIYDETLNEQPQPWRAGANENTLIKFTHDVMINDESLKAGTYGLHIFVKEHEWQLAFSKDTSSWGSFSYNAENDALRVTVIPKDGEDQEWLSYRFLHPRPDEVTIELHWADKKIHFEVSTKVDANIIADVEQMEVKNWHVLINAARSKLRLYPQAIDEVVALVDSSLSMEKQFSSLMFKVELLEMKGALEEAKLLRSTAIDSAEANELFAYAMHLNKLGDDENTLKILSLNLQKNPEHWMSYLGYGHYYRDKKDLQAIDYLKKAVQFAPDRARGFANYQLGYTKNKLKQ